MTHVLLRKILRDVWPFLAVVALLLFTFEALWSRVTRHVQDDLIAGFIDLVRDKMVSAGEDMAADAPGGKAADAFGVMYVGAALADNALSRVPPPADPAAAAALGRLRQAAGRAGDSLAALLRRGPDGGGREKMLGLGREIQQIAFDNGPGQVVQAMIGGESIDLMDTSAMMSIGYVHPLVQTILCIWAIGRAAGAVSGELERGTMELLLSQPVPRRAVIQAHLLADLITVPALCLAMWLGTCLGAYLSGMLSACDPADLVRPARFLPSLLNVAALVLAVAGLTMALSSAGRSRGRVMGLAIILVLLQFLINVLGQLWGVLRPLRPYTVFYYYQPQAIILHDDWAVSPAVWLHLGVLLAVGLAGYMIALAVFTRRDLPAPL